MIVFLAAGFVAAGCVVYRLVSTDEAATTPKAYRWLSIEAAASGVVAAGSYAGIDSAGLDPELLSLAGSALAGGGATAIYMRTPLSSHIGRRVELDIEQRMIRERRDLAKAIADHDLLGRFWGRYAAERAIETHPEGAEGLRKDYAALLRGNDFRPVEKVSVLFTFIAAERKHNAVGRLTGLDDWPAARTIAQDLLKANESKGESPD